MNLNNMGLTNEVLTELFPSSLVIVNSDIPTPGSIEQYTQQQDTDTKKAGLISLGENKKKITILIKYEKIKHIPDENLEFLSGILTACDLCIGDVAIVNMENCPGISYIEILKHFSSKMIIMFGVEPGAINMPVIFPEFQTQSFNNSLFLLSPSLEELKNDKVLKSKLWVCLKRMFSI